MSVQGTSRLDEFAAASREATSYNGTHFELPREFLRSITTLEPVRSFQALVLAWAALTGLCLMMTRAVPGNLFWWLYLPVAFLIAGRQGALLQLVHEASHNLLSRSPRVNRLMGTWCCAFPLGLSLEGYLAGHLKHHAHANTPLDPASDREKYEVTDPRDPKLYLLFLKDLLGLTALKSFLAYLGNQQERATARGGPSGLQTLACIALVQALIFAALFRCDAVNYFLLWLVPILSPHMILMRVRGIAEHGLPSQLGIKVTDGGQGNFYTRSLLTEARCYGSKFPVWLERLLIGSLSVNYHHEHHLFPGVPFYHLRRLHREIGERVRDRHADVYSRGYFSALAEGQGGTHK